MAWKTVISMVKYIEPGETIGYGRTYTAQSRRLIATLPTGYADGYSRRLSNRGTVIIRGQKAPVVGRVCMDQMTVDVTAIPDVAPGDEVLLLDRDSYTADHMAQAIGTIGYEVACGISARVTRTYIRGKNADSPQ